MFHKIRPNKKLKSKKRIGRGGKRGTTSGRGQKGQKSRSGHKMRPAFRDTLIRTPKLRGFRNKPLTQKSQVISLDDLSKLTANEISFKTLIQAGLIKKSHNRAVKILGSGEIKKPVIVKKISVSKTARQKIEKAGGKVL